MAAHTPGRDRQGMATIAMILSICGLCCPLVGAVGAFIGASAMSGLNRRDGGYDTAVGALILGLATFVLWAVVLIIAAVVSPS